MEGRRFRVPLAICYADDRHFLRRGEIPLFKYLQDVLHCWGSQRGVNRYLAERAILSEVKVSGLLNGIRSLRDLRCRLLEHKRLARRAKTLSGKFGVQKTGKIKNPTCRLDPTVKVLAVVGGSLVPCKGNNFRRCNAYRESSNDRTSVVDPVFTAQQPFSHDAEENALADQLDTLRKNQPRRSVCDALEVWKRDDGRNCSHVMLNVF